MDAIRRTLTLRRVATTASLATLLVAPGAADAKKAKPKSPVITSVSPMSATVGQKLTIHGRNFRKGKGKNSVGFKRDGEAVVFVKAGVSTTKVMAVTIPTRLGKVLDGAPARVHLRILAQRFGKSFTPNKLSPIIAPKPAANPAPGAGPGAGAAPTVTAVPTVTVAPTAPTCVATESDSVDSDGDLLSDALENKLGTAGCDADSDDDNVTDGYEYRSAIDLNDDEYQNPNSAIPYPGARPYPNPLDADSNKDYDGDGLSMSVEYSLWDTLTPKTGRTLQASGSQATPLLYSDGLQYSVSRFCGAGETGGACGTGNTHQNRRVPALVASTYSKWQDFLTWAGGAGYGTISVHDNWAYPWYDHANGRHDHDIRDVDLSNGPLSSDELVPDDLDHDGFLSDNERDEDADGLTNYAEFGGYMQPAYWAACYTRETPYLIAYAGTDPTKADSDGDGIRDGADDQDHDDIPNFMEQSRIAASHDDDSTGVDCTPKDNLSDSNHPGDYGRVNPFNPCLPDTGSRSCPQVITGKYAPFDGSPNWWSLQ